MATVHLVYPHRPRITAPHSIGRKLAERLARRYDVVLHELDEPRALRPGPGDVLIGHPHEAPWTVFRRSAARPGWRRVLMLMPYVHVDTYHVSLAEPVIRNCDLFLAITGKTWFDAVPDSVTAHWRPKMVHVDLAVDRADFPRVKTAFAAPGSRRFLYIGHTGWYKNTGYLSELARRLPEAEIAWMGGGGAIPGVRPLGRQDFATPAARELVAQHDFLLTVGSGDANPSSILEAMAWGLVPVCTPESGYPAQAGIVNVPLDDPGAAVDTLRRLQAAPDEELRALRAANDDLLAGHFTWDRFAAQVVDAIESDASPELLPLEPAQARRLRTLALRRQASWLLPPNLRFAARSALRATRPGRAVLAARARRRS